MRVRSWPIREAQVTRMSVSFGEIEPLKLKYRKPSSLFIRLHAIVQLSRKEDTLSGCNRFLGVFARILIISIGYEKYTLITPIDN